MRKIDSCMNCGGEREIVAHGLCAKCYMAGRRAGERLDDPFSLSPNRINRRYIAERNKMLVNLTRIIKLVDETPCLSPEDTATIKVTIQPYLLERANDLAPRKSEPELTVNTKLESTVSSNDLPPDAETKLTANTDSELTVNSEPEGADGDGHGHDETECHNAPEPVADGPEESANDKAQVQRQVR